MLKSIQNLKNVTVLKKSAQKSSLGGVNGCGNSCPPGTYCAFGSCHQSGSNPYRSKNR